MQPGRALLVAFATLVASSGHAREAVRATIPVNFVNVSREAGTAIPHVWGSRDNQRYIIEVKGSGLGYRGSTEWQSLARDGHCVPLNGRRTLHHMRICRRLRSL